MRHDDDPPRVFLGERHSTHVFICAADVSRAATPANAAEAIMPIRKSHHLGAEDPRRGCQDEDQRLTENCRPASGGYKYPPLSRSAEPAKHFSSRKPVGGMSPSRGNRGDRLEHELPLRYAGMRQDRTFVLRIAD